MMAVDLPDVAGRTGEDDHALLAIYLGQRDRRSRVVGFGKGKKVNAVGPN
jgi:hypothetical protein